MDCCGLQPSNNGIEVFEGAPHGHNLAAAGLLHNGA